MFSYNGKFIWTAIVLLYSTFINWNPEINHSCCLATLKQEVENMTFTAKYKQQTDKITFFPGPTNPTNLLRVDWRLINIFLSHVLAFWRPDVVSKNIILLRILHSLGCHQMISWPVDIKISHLTFTSSFNLNKKTNQISIKSLYLIHHWLIAVFYGN